jgi:O-antigen/teichoic acid export membrane protein
MGSAGPVKVRGSGVIENLAGQAVAGAAGLATLLLIAAVHGPTALGRFNLLFAVYLVASQVATLGLHVSVVRHLPPVRDAVEERGRVIRGAVLATLISGGATMSVLHVARETVAAMLGRPDIAGMLSWTALGVAVFALNKVLLASITAVGRLRLHAGLLVLRGALMVGLLVAFILLGVDPDRLFLIIPVTEVVLVIPTLAANAAAVAPRAWRSGLDGWTIRHLRFGALGAASTMLTELNLRIDVLVLALFVDDAAIGVYALAIAIVEALMRIGYVHQTVLGPTVVRLIADGDLVGLTALARAIRRRLWSVLAILSATILALHPVIVELLESPGTFRESRDALAILLLGLVVSSGYHPFAFLLAHAGRPLLQSALVGLLVLLNVVGNLLLVPRFGLLGAATATATVHILSVPLLRGMARRIGLRI